MVESAPEVKYRSILDLDLPITWIDTSDEKLEMKDEKYDYPAFRENIHVGIETNHQQGNHISHLSSLTSQLESSHLSPLTSHLATPHFAAMVPLQVWHSLQVPAERERLRAIRHIIIGGGPIDDALARELADFPNNVWSTYGMTETLSHIALRRLNGPTRSEWYTPFEGVGISLNDEGCLVVDAPAVCAEPLVTNDIAELRPETTDEDCQTASSGIASGQPANGAVGRRIQFRILGRRDNVICSGGVKIQIEQVEQVLRAHTDVPLLITKPADRLLGEQVVMLTESSDLSSLQSLCRRVLPRYWQPRRILTVDSLPLTPTGKPARSEAMRIAEANCTLHNT
jgi:O-succinylbenzoic acid--CoA ligase